MPRIFRTVGFLALVVLPIVAQVKAYVTLRGDVCIAWKPRHWWKATDYHVILNHDLLFTFPPKPESDRNYANWRFMRLKLPEKTVMDRKRREPNGDDNDGRDENDKRQEPVQISAFPGYAPWAFRISAYGCALAAGWLLITRDRSLPLTLIELIRGLSIHGRPKPKRRVRSPRPK